MDWLNPQTEFSLQTDTFRKPTERISSFTDLLLQPVAKKQASYFNDTIYFVRFIENTPLPDHTIFATLDVYLLYTNIPQEEGIKVAGLQILRRTLSA